MGHFPWPRSHISLGFAGCATAVSECINTNTDTNTDNQHHQPTATSGHSQPSQPANATGTATSNPGDKSEEEHAGHQ
jgi:hypothetical protein